ncbi:MAG: PorT family protein [Saprospiraceae bacterium]|nr:PorT family protein [Saprospiraceae bacterium]
MKQLTIFLLTLSSFSSYGQDKTKETPTVDFKKVQIGINISPDICFRTLKNNDGSSTSNIVMKLNNENETVKVGYTAGLNVCFNIKKFVGIETGIQYSNKGYQTKMKDLIFGQPDPLAPNKAKFIYNFHYIDIPVKANFTIGKKKVRFFTSVGLTTNIFIKETQTSVLVYSDRTDRKTNPTNFDYNRVNISPTISVGIDYKINSKMNLRVEPTFRYGVLKIIDAPVTGYLYSGGLNISYYFGH